MKKLRAIFLASLLSLPLLADEEGSHQIDLPADLAPWFTGPLIARSAYTVEPPHWTLQPYLYFTTNAHTYNSQWRRHSIPNFYTTNVQFQAKRGLVSGFDFQFIPQVICHETQGKRSCNIGDMTLSFGVRLLDSKLKDPWPAMRLALRTNVPLGKYQHLNPKLLRTDSMGTGSWLPAANFHMSKMWRVSGNRFFDMRFVAGYQVGTAVHVKGVNTYGGARNTRGVIYPGNILMFDWAMQLSLTHRWAFACDIIYQHTNKTRFSGRAGTTNGAPVVMRAPSRELVSLAPAIEYNWSQNFGIISGVWFSFAGRNSRQFTSGVIALSIYK